MKPARIVTIPLSNLGIYLLRRVKMRFAISSIEKKNQQYLVEKEILGKIVTLNLKDLDQRYLYEDHVREPENILTYLALARNSLCKIFIDIGANYGHDAIMLVEEYEKIVLVEPNPSAVGVLQTIFKGKKNVEIINAAIVGKDSPRELILRVPKDSSALASVVESPLMRNEIDTFVCKGLTLNECISKEELSKAYIKIDVEGGEYAILTDIADEIMNAKAIVGFEALSREFAVKCASLLKGYTYYYAKFDFLENSGSLIRSPLKLIGALLGKDSSISVYKIDGNDFSLAPNNFSQVYCVPKEKEFEFEKSIQTTEETKIDCLKIEY